MNGLPYTCPRGRAIAPPLSDQDVRREQFGDCVVGLHTVWLVRVSTPAYRSFSGTHFLTNCLTNLRDKAHHALNKVVLDTNRAFYVMNVTIPYNRNT